MKTQANGNKTAKSKGRHSPLDVYNKDDRFDYSFRRKADIEQGGGEDILGYTPVNEVNNSGEVSGGPLSKFQKTKSSKQIAYLDTVLCRRPKEVAEYFKSEEDRKYNAQVKFVREVAKSAKEKYRNNGMDETVRDESSFSGSSMKQRKGTTESLMDGSEGVEHKKEKHNG